MATPALLSYFGSFVVDILLIKQLEQDYDVQFLINCEKLGQGSPKSTVNWHFDRKKGQLRDEKSFKAKLGKTVSKRFIVANISLDNCHRNVIIIDNEKKIIHYFEPNDLSLSSNDLTRESLSYQKEYKLRQEKYTKTRIYFIKLIQSIPRYSHYDETTRWYNLALIYYNISEYYDKDDPVYEIFADQGCVAISYFFIIKTLKSLDIVKSDSFEMLERLLALTKSFKGYEGYIYNERSITLEVVKKLLRC